MSSTYVDLFLTIIPVFLILYLGVLTYLHNRKSVLNIFFSLISLSTVFWSIANYISITLVQSEHMLLWSRMVLLFAVPHAILFFAFIYNFPQTKIVNYKLLTFLLIVMIVVMVATISPFVFTKIDILDGKILPQAGPLMPLFTLTALGSLLAGLFTIAIRYRRSKKEERRQWRAMLIGTCLSYTLIILTNFVLVVFYKDTSFLKFGPLFMIPTIIGLGYSILRYRVMNIKSIATEILTLIILSISMLEVLVAKNNQELIFRLVLFIFYLVFGILIIRSVLKEVSQREYIEKLARQLSQANDDLKIANNKLKELDRQKTEFVSIASHQLRSPLTAIKGYSSMLLEGSFGPLTEKPKEAVDRIFQSSEKLVMVIEDFLNITRIELGRMKYEIKVFDLGQLAQSVIKDQELNIKKHNLTISFENGIGDHQVSADEEKISQVLSNLIDNATKYTPAGWIKVRVENLPVKGSKVKETVRISVSDSGVGIKSETLPKLFEKFVRADASKVNINGTGLGLYVAKQIVEGLGGKIYAESEGKGKGSTFFVEFPKAKSQTSPA